MPTRRLFIAAGATCLLARPRRVASEPVPADDGLYKQSWFLDSFLELGDDLAEAAERGRGLMVLFEQAGCPYCRELHRVNFSRPEIVDHLAAHYDVVQLDLWGARTVVDLDGEELEERALAEKWGVTFTPTSVLFAPETAGAARGAAEAFRMPGYLKPFHYLSSLEYVSSGAYRNQPFQRFLQDKFADLRAQGIDPDVW
jgi:thioredoxin-related protein